MQNVGGSGDDTGLRGVGVNSSASSWRRCRLVCADDDKVGASDARLVGKVNHEATVVDRGVGAIHHRAESIRISDLEGVRHDLAMLSAVVSDLASLGKL